MFKWFWTIDSLGAPVEAVSFPDRGRATLVSVSALERVLSFEQANWTIHNLWKKSIRISLEFRNRRWKQDFENLTIFL